MVPKYSQTIDQGTKLSMFDQTQLLQHCFSISAGDFMQLLFIIRWRRASDRMSSTAA